YSCALTRTSPIRVLHSFPTRRSSDLFDTLLPHRRLQGVQPFSVRREEGMIGELCERGSSPQSKSRGQPPSSLAGLAVLEQRQGLDRKSTRLNSSHRTISYAVFCLKKK